MSKLSLWNKVWLVGIFCALAPRSSSAPTPSSSVRQEPQASSANALCNTGRSVCVPQVTANVLITNPVDIAATAAGSVGDVSWELDDQAGQRLASDKASHDPNWNTGSNPTSSKLFHMRDYVFILPKSATGTLKLSPVQYDQQGTPFQLPELDILVQFGSATSALAVVVPKDPHQYLSEVTNWFNGSQPHTPQFSASAPLAKKRITVMHVNDVVLQAPKPLRRIHRCRPRHRFASFILPSKAVRHMWI